MVEIAICALHSGDVKFTVEGYDCTASQGDLPEIRLYVPVPCMGMCSHTRGRGAFQICSATANMIKHDIAPSRGRVAQTEEHTHCWIMFKVMFELAYVRKQQHFIGIHHDLIKLESWMTGSTACHMEHTVGSLLNRLACRAPSTSLV